MTLHKTATYHFKSATFNEKLAKARWQKEQEKQIRQQILSQGGTPQDAAKAVVRSRDFGDIRRQKAEYQAFKSPLTTPQQVQRRSKLDKKLTEWYLRHGDALRVNPGPLGAANIAGTVLMNPDKFPQFLKGIAERTGMPLPNIPDSAWPAITKAVLDHEKAEGVQLGNVLAGEAASAAHASHAGLLPLLAERMNVQDPHAVAVMNWMRKLNPEDRKAARILKQHGQVGNYVLPFGGKAHRSAEAQVINKITPELPPMQLQRMVSSAQGAPRDFIAQTSAIPAGTPAQMRSVRGGLSSGQVKGLAALGLMAAPFAYGYYRYRKGRKDQVEESKTASVKKLLASPQSLGQLGGIVGLPLWVHHDANNLVKNQIVEEDPYLKYKLYGAPLGAGLATYGLLSHKYPKASPAAKVMGALSVGGLASQLASYGLMGETAGRSELDAAIRYAQAKREGAKFNNYYSDPAFTQGRYNDLFAAAAHGTPKPWHSYFLNNEIENNIEEYKL